MLDLIKNSIKKLNTTGFFHVFGSSVINKVIAFASSIILVRILTKAEYGIYTYADNILGFFVLATGLGATSGVLQICSETKDDQHRKELYYFGCRFGLFANMFLCVLILIIAIVVPLPIEHSNNLLALMCLLPLVSLISELQRTYLRTEFRNKEYSYANTFNTIITFLGSCLLAFLLKAQGLVLAHYLAGLVTICFILLFYHVPIRVSTSNVSKEEKKQMLSISSISMVNNGLSRLMYLLDIFILGFVIKSDAVIASYKIATIIPTALSFIPSAIVTYVYPFFARNRNNKQWVINNYRKLTIGAGTLNFFVAIVLVIFAPIIIRIIFGQQYNDAMIPFRILSISFAFSGTFRIIAGNLLVTQRKLRFNFYIAILSGLLNTILNVFLIQIWGSIGASVATLATVLIISILNVGYLAHTFRQIKDENDG